MSLRGVFLKIDSKKKFDWLRISFQLEQPKTIDPKYFNLKLIVSYSFLYFLIWNQIGVSISSSYLLFKREGDLRFCAFVMESVFHDSCGFSCCSLNDTRHKSPSLIRRCSFSHELSPMSSLHWSMLLSNQYLDMRIRWQFIL